MTEIIYIFPKQLQSVAVLAFIAVLIILLLILTVMVHMRNRKLKRTLEEQMAEKGANRAGTRTQAGFCKGSFIHRLRQRERD